MATAADVLVDTLIDWKIDTIFGLPGDGINGIVEALRKRQEAIRFIQVRHEQSAAFMATAYAKWTGKLGVCLATSGPGGTNLLTGLYDAKLDQVPLLAVTGMQYHDLAETFTQQDVNLTRVFEDVSVYNTIVSDAAHMENAASLACRTAMARRGVAHISIANDTQEKPAGQGRSRRNLPKHVPNDWFSYKPLPSDDLIEQAAALLNRANRVAILAGRGALGAREELRLTAKLLAAPVAKALLGKAIMDDDDPHTTGGIGILGTAPSQDIMEDCDALLIVGSTFPYIEYYPDPQSVKAVQIDLDPQRIGLRHNAVFPKDGSSGRCSRSGDGAAVRAEADQRGGIAVFLAAELADIQFAAHLAHFGMAGIADMEVVRPDHRLGLRSRPLQQMVEHFEHVAVAQVPGFRAEVTHDAVVFFRGCNETGVLRAVEKGVVAGRLDGLAKKLPALPHHSILAGLVTGGQPRSAISAGGVLPGRQATVALARDSGGLRVGGGEIGEHGSDRVAHFVDIEPVEAGLPIGWMGGIVRFQPRDEGVDIGVASHPGGETAEGRFPVRLLPPAHEAIDRSRIRPVGLHLEKPCRWSDVL